MNATVLTAAMDLSETMALETSKLNEMVGGIAGALGGIADMTNEDVKYIPLEDFMTEKLLAEAQNDFDSSELVFEHEF